VYLHSPREARPAFLRWGRPGNHSRRKEIYEALHPETRAGVAQAAGMNRAIGRGDVGAENAPTFTKATARKKQQQSPAAP
jgi:hypothetical protein